MKTRLSLLFIIILFFVSRLYRISNIPPSVYWDEASIGYNAYSVSVDGKDEWGSFLPLHFRAFGEFKLPVYIYSVVPFVSLLGLNALAVRLPSVLYSLGVVVLTFLIMRKITKNSTVSLFSSLFVVVTPWLFIFSRTGYEATAGLIFFMMGVYFYLKSLAKPRWFLVMTISFIVSMYSYNSFRAISFLSFPIFAGYFIWVYRKTVREALWCLIISLVLILVSVIPIIRLYKLDAGGQRLASVALSGTYVQKARQFVVNYSLHFSPGFLFSKGDTNLRSQIPGFGQIYWISLPFVLFGVVIILKKRKPEYFLILFLLLISPIPAALTKESPHALRSILSLPCYAIISGFGLGYFIGNYKKYSSAILVITSLVFLLFFGLYLNNFFSNYSALSASDWQYQYKEVFAEYSLDMKNANKIIITDEYAQPYIFALFYTKYDSNLFRKSAIYNSVDRWGFSTVYSFGKFIFKETGSNDLQPGTLIFNKKQIQGLNSKSIVTLPDGLNYLYIYKI